ncbi:receptor activity-modifying protein 3 [Labrus bergylta]|uniref:Receptor activity-modifying protein 3 n=1 Tax=Labrus bergylta TaxID=56723 RepID=A0A3Q3EFC7_9LABR|nr:receptor activity-modifying protein 3-like [Labrus bergylta]
MDLRESAVLKLFMVVFVANVSMMRDLTGADSVTPPPPHRWMCNESRLQWEVEVCGDDFKRNMDHVDPKFWCNLTHFISEYNLFSLCTETKSKGVECYWPNPLVESYIIRIHKTFFSNCTNKPMELVDPPNETLTLLILIPVFLTLAMIAVVVWCSKRSDLLA